VRVPKDAACWTATSAPCDAAGHLAAITPPVAAATDAKARIFSSSFVQPEATVCGGAGHLQIKRSGYILYVTGLISNIRRFTQYMYIHKRSYQIYKKSTNKL
jgi:hypothetical protein